MDSDTRTALATYRDTQLNPLLNLPPGGVWLPPTGQLRQLHTAPTEDTPTP